MKIEPEKLEAMFTEKLARVENSYDQEDLEIMEQCLIDLTTILAIEDEEEKEKELKIITTTLANVEDKVRLRIAKIVEESLTQILGLAMKAALVAIRPA